MYRTFVTFYFRVGQNLCRRMGWRLKGIGFLLRRFRSKFYFRVEGRQFCFEPECGGAYCLLPAGLWNEPETHRFFRMLLARCDSPFVFVDVGASVGEMVIDLAGFSDVRKVFAFEPQASCAQAIRESARLNGFDNVEVIQAAVGDRVGFVPFAADPRSPTGAQVQVDSSLGPTVEQTTLDAARLPAEVEILLQIDVEGYEPAVLRGGRHLLQSRRPLVVFEYNRTSKSRYRLPEVREILGPDYEICRLRGDGMLDDQVENAWNCVAIPCGSPWSTARELIVRCGRTGIT